MAMKLDKDHIKSVMAYANCDEKLAKVWLKHHKGRLALAMIDAKADAQMMKINAASGSDNVTQDIINLSN